MVLLVFGIFQSKEILILRKQDFLSICILLNFRQELISRINESKKLNEEYQANFHKTKAKLQESENERQWNFRYEE